MLGHALCDSASYPFCDILIRNKTIYLSLSSFIYFYLIQKVLFGISFIKVKMSF